jgi:alanyl-tRNA synthetase
MVHAGDRSLELCGGTHVRALGQIGEFVVRSESSVGSNLRRIEAITGRAAHEDHRNVRDLLRTVADTLRVPPESVPEAVGRLQTSLSDQERERRQLVAQLDTHHAATLAESAVDGVVVARADERDGNALRELAEAIRRRPGVRAVGLIGSPDGEAVTIAVAFDDDSGDAPSAVRAAAKVVGGGGGGRDKRSAVGGGRDVTAIDAALDALRSQLAGEPVGS